uniref:Uncharacterized protein n=1 Tax=Acrobeloides nanus TaxID=290746 RepID=A0A914E0A6_9BILA
MSQLVCRWWNDLVLKGTNQLPLRTIEKLCYGFSQTNPYKNNSRWGYQYCIGLLRDPLTPKIRNNGLKSCVFRNFHAYLADDKFYKKLENFVKDYGKKIKVEEVKFVLPEQGKEIIETRLEEIRQIWDKFLVGDRLQLVLGEPSEDAMEDMVDARSFSYLLTKPALVNMPVPHPKIEIICNDEQYHGEYDLYEYNENVMMKFLSGIHFPEGLKVALTLKHHTWNRNFGAALARLFLEHDNPEKMVCPIITKEYVGYEHVWLTLQYFRSRNLPHRSKRSSTITTYEAERKDGWVFVMDYYSKRYPQNTEFLKFSFRSPRKDVDGSEGDSGALNQRLRGLLDQNQIIELD